MKQMATPGGPFADCTGLGVRVAVIDSGVHSSHPHIGGVSGGVTIGPSENDESFFTDVIGHGTAVMAAIKEKAPAAHYFAVRVFDAALRTNIEVLVRAIEWSILNRIDVVNLSLGTTNPAHGLRLEPVIARAQEAGLTLVSAAHVEGTPSFPGNVTGVIGVEVDWGCPRDAYSVAATEKFTVRASGYPRSVPGIPPAKNLQGISFAVANVTGFVVRACEGLRDRSFKNICAALAANRRDSS